MNFYLNNNNRISFVSILFLAGCINMAFAQSGTPELPQTIVPSPTAASLGKFGDVPVGYYTGTPGISVPLYEIKTKGLSLPITLSYDATGVRVTQDASWVGLGWSLLAGGLVTRVVRGNDDFGSYGFLGADPFPASGSNEEQLYDINMWKGIIDGEPDIFAYNFAGYSGKFLIDKISNGATIFGSPRNNLDIKFDYNGGHFTITTPDGNQYYFGTKETVTNRYTSEFSGAGIDPSTYVGLAYFGNASETANSSWYLDKITSPSGDTIKFIYQTGRSLGLISRNEKHFFNLDRARYGLLFQAVPEYISKVDSRQNIEDVILEKIEFASGRIEFETSAREDMEIPTSEFAPQKLSSIKVYNNSQIAPIKEITFGHSYFNPSDTHYYEKRLKLDYVQIDQPENKYAFSYYKPTELPSKYSRQVDEWGFYTSSFYNPFSYTTSFNYPDLYPRVQTTFNHVVIDGVPQQRGDATGDYLKRGILTSITYPTKGRSEFDYEPNDYGNADPLSNRVIQTAILDFSDPDPNNQITGSENALDTITLSQATYVSFTATTSYNGSDPLIIGFIRHINGTGIITLSTTQGNPTGGVYQTAYYEAYLDSGQYVIEAHELSEQMTKIDAVYDVFQPVGDTKGAGLRIKSITNYDANSTIVGKKTFSYTLEGSSASSGLLLSKAKDYYETEVSYSEGPYPEPDNNSEYEDEVYEALTYRIHERSGYYLIRSSNSLFPDGFYSRPNAVGYSRVSITDGIDGNNGTTIYNYYNQEAEDELNPEPYPDKPALFESRNGQLLSSEVLNSAGHVVQKTSYDYERKEKYTLKAMQAYKAPFEPLDQFEGEVNYALDYLPDKIHYYDNSSEWWVQSKKTQTNYLNNGTEFGITQQTDNYDNALHKQVTSTEIVKSDQTTHITTFKYPHDFAGTQPYNDMVNTYHIWNPVIEQHEYKNDTISSGNLLESTKTDYQVWNSNPAQIYPVTVSTRKGTANYKARIQYHVYDSQGNVTSVSKSGGPKENYIYSYGGRYPVAQITNADYSAIITALGGQNAVDDFRSNLTPSDNTVNTFLTPLRNRSLLPSAQVTTYTYQPLVGVTSMTDSRGNKTTYEYDNSQRLINVKDQNGNIKTRYCYNYAGASVGCLVAATPIPPDSIPDPPVGIYVRIEITDVGYEYYGDETEYSSYQTGNVCIKLYSDPACTIPLTLSYDLPVVMDLSDDILDDVNGNSTEPSYAIYTITAGNNSYCLGSMDLDDLYHYQDEFSNPHYQEFIYHYDLVPGSTVYRNKPAVTF